MKTLKQRTEDALAAGFTVGQLAKAAGKTSSAVSQWLNGSTKAIKAESAIGLQALTGWAAAWWATGKGPKASPPPDVAHALSYPKIDTPPITVWEDVVSLEKMPVIPADLMVQVPDDALAARGISKGQLIWFKSASHAEPRNVVLIEANGRRYIRRYAEDGQGPFAQALDDAFPSFRQFEIVAVMFMKPQSSI